MFLLYILWPHFFNNLWVEVSWPWIRMHFMQGRKTKGSAITTSSCNKSMGSSYEHWNLDGGSFRGSSRGNKFGRNAHNLSSTSLRKRSNLVIVSKVRWGVLRQALANLQEVVLGTKLSILFPVIPLVIVAQRYNFGSVSVRVFSFKFFFFLKKLHKCP